MAPVTGLPAGTDGYAWWNDTVFYEVFVRSFYDSDGDGIGDLSGLIERLDYLNDGDPATTTDLGVTGLWLMPIHPSPSYHGYDVTDYYDVNPDYGTRADFQRLMREAHRRGLRVIVDLVLNHTSSQHPWFVAAHDAQSPYRDWYRWSPAIPPGESNWHPSPAGDYYYGLFTAEMPDLNYRNPAVTAEMEEVARFWLQDMGADGFRLDAAKHLVEEGALQANSDATHAWYRDFRVFYKALDPQVLTVGEIGFDTSVNVATYTQGDELDLGFDFDLARAFILSARTGHAEEAQRVLAIDLRLFQPGQFATFLTNHDQDRVMSQLAGKVAKAKAAAALLLTAPGVPFIYYGEEIGMLGRKPDEEIRTPMQWSAEAQGGFTTGTPWEAPNPDFIEHVNVADESTDPDALLQSYRALVALRNGHAALRVGEAFVLESGHPALYALLRVSAGEAVLVLINLGPDPVSDYRLSLDHGPLAGRYRAAPLFGAGPFADLDASAAGGLDAYQPLPVLPGYGTFVVQLQPVK